MLFRSSYFLAGGEYPVWTYDMFQASPGYSYIKVAYTGVGGYLIFSIVIVLITSCSQYIVHLSNSEKTSKNEGTFRKLLSGY